MPRRKSEPSWTVSGTPPKNGVNEQLAASDAKFAKDIAKLAQGAKRKILRGGTRRGK